MLVLQSLLQFHQFIYVDFLSLLQLLVGLPESIYLALSHLLNAQISLRSRHRLDIVLFLRLDWVVGVSFARHVGVCRRLSRHIRY